MKKILLAALLIGCSVVTGYAQQHAPTPDPKNIPQRPPAPYLNDAELPSFKILESDSTTTFDTKDIEKGKRAIIIFFDPGCSHCIAFMEKFFPAMDSFKKVNIYMVTVVHDMSRVRKFMDEYHTKNYKNIKVVGKDTDFYFISHYGIQRFPAAAVYDKHKKFVKLVESDEVTVSALYEATH